jgi:CRISPR/Cas system-associated exonuclease Cas4 (RecB family)
MAYSYSAVKLYEQCPSRYKFNRIDRLQEPSGDAASRGSLIHSEIESIIKGELPLASNVVQYLIPQLNKWKLSNAQSEMQFAINEAWDLVDYKDKNAWFRGVIDLYFEEDDTATVLDFKTGKERDYVDQVSVYAAVVLATKPHINRVNLVIEFIDSQKNVQYSRITRDELGKYKDELANRISTINKDNIFAANPSGLCKFCHFRKSNGGPCKW